MGSLASLLPHGGSMPHLCYEGWQAGKVHGTPLRFGCNASACQVKRDTGWDPDSSLMVQTNPPEGPAVLHVTCELGEHVSGKYWLVEGMLLSKRHAADVQNGLRPSRPFPSSLQGEFRNHRHVWKRANSAEGPWISSGSDGSWFLQCSPSSAGPRAGPVGPWKSLRCVGTPM